MKRKIISIFFLGLFFNVTLSAAEIPLLPIKIDTDSQETLQRGARIFMNYCSGCHSLRYLRYNRMAKDLGLTTFDGAVDNDLLKNNLIFTHATVADPIQISMPEADARQWFGRLPPDLSLTARERGHQWIYTYLKSFYADAKRPFGANNLLVPDVSMPNILAPLSGIYIKSKKHNTGHPDTRLILIKDGQMTEQQFDGMLIDLVTFLSYVSDPTKATRYYIGFWVLPFLFLFLMIIYRLKKLYWKGV